MAGGYKHRSAADCLPIPQGDGTSIVPLTKGQTAIIDTIDESLVSPYRWCARPHANGRGFYASSNKLEGGSRLYMHRLILGLSEGTVVADHIDNDGLNNRRSNLRVATVSQNVWNIHNAYGESRYKGVCRSASALNPWRAQIGFENGKTELGIFATEEAAALAYNEAAKEMFGEFAKLNDVDPSTVTQTRKPRPRKYRYRGIHFRRGKYTAVLSRGVNGRTRVKTIGTFATALEAALAYDAAAIEYDGHDRKTNHALGLLPTSQEAAQ